MTVVKAGEEFVVLLYDTNFSQAQMIAEKFREKIQQQTFSGLKITISIGVICSYIKRNTDVDDLLKKADEVLYEAKEAGRNRVCSIDLSQ